MYASFNPKWLANEVGIYLPLSWFELGQERVLKCGLKCSNWKREI